MDVPVTVAVLGPMCRVRLGRVALQGTSLMGGGKGFRSQQGSLKRRLKISHGSEFVKTDHNVRLSENPSSKTAPGTRL